MQLIREAIVLDEYLNTYMKSVYEEVKIIH